ncbi:MAG: MATE family efflux transporter [Firmicutes bacterium]|nr:MATE family efflux transporter [Bacillota bacterium]
MEDKNSRPFDTDHIVRTYFRLALPVVLSSVVTILYNLADTYFIADTGDPILVAGVSLCGPVFTVLMAFGNIFGQGGSSLISRLIGADDHSAVRRVSSFCFWIAILTGVVIAVPMLLLKRPILHLLGASPDTFVHSEQYYTILAFGAPVIIANFIHLNLLRCEGMALQSMIGTLIGSVVNVILDPIMITGLGWGAAGAAAATVIGYVLSDLFLLAVVLRKSRYFSVRPQEARVTGSQAGSIFSIGITAAITNIASSVCNILLNRQLVAYGDEKIAAMGIVMRVNMIALMMLVGFSFGGVPLFGYLSGAGDKKKRNELLRFCLLFLAGLSLTLTAVLFICAPGLIRLFIQDEGIIADGTVMLRYLTSGAVFAALVMLLTCVFQASGKALPALMLSLSRQGVIFAVVLLIAAKAAGYNGVIASQLIADIVSAGFAIGLYFAFVKREKPEKTE